MDDVLTAVLAIVQRAPLVPLTDEERAMLAEVEGSPVRWLSHETFMSKMRLHDDAT